MVVESAAAAGMVERAVADAGHTLIRCADRKAAKAVYTTDPAPAMIVDWKVDDATRLIKEIRRLPDGDFCYLVAIATPDDAGAALDAGCDDFVLSADCSAELPLRLRIASRRVQERARQRQDQERLLHNAFHDPLTGLPNRALFMDRLWLAAERTRRREFRYAVLFVDLDRFKQINDTHGHPTGDKVLKEVGARLENCLRPGDTIARFGGDEFTVLTENVREARDAIKVADRILLALSRPFELGDLSLDTTASVGIALSSSGYDAPKDILRAADTALYRAKAHGSGRREVYDDAMQNQAMESLQVEVELRKALEKGQLRLHYQPVVDLPSGRIEGFEALLRWQHPKRGLLHPSDFLEVAEETGLLVPIGWWALRELGEQLQTWRELGAGPVAIGLNLSAIQFLHADLLPKVDELLLEFGIQPGEVWLEITESVITHHEREATTRIQALHDRGLQVHLDDFGTGFSSFTQLQSCPLHTIKIDGSFTSTLTTAGGDGDLLASMVALARALGMRSVVEGVETDSQLEQVRPLGSDGVQGYLFSQPLPPKKAEKLVRDSAVYLH